MVMDMGLYLVTAMAAATAGFKLHVPASKQEAVLYIPPSLLSLKQALDGTPPARACLRSASRGVKQIPGITLCDVNDLPAVLYIVPVTFARQQA